MKNYFYILIVFILGIVFGAGGCMLIHKYFIQSEAKEVVNAVETKVAEDEFVSGSDFAESVPVASFIPQKVNIQELKPLAKPQNEQTEEEDSHIFFTMFSALSVIGLILAIAFGINASHSDRTRDMAVFFSIAAGACIIAAFVCY